MARQNHFNFSRIESVFQHTIQKKKIIVLFLVICFCLVAVAQETLNVGATIGLNGNFFSPNSKSKKLSDVPIVTVPALGYNVGAYLLYTSKNNVGIEGKFLFQQNKVSLKANYITDGLRLGFIFLSSTNSIKANYRITRKKVSIIPALGLNISYNNYFGVHVKYKNENGQASSEPIELAQSEFSSFVLAGPEISVTICKANMIKPIGFSVSFSYTPYITALPFDIAKFKVYNTNKYLYLQGFYSYACLSVNLFFNKNFSSNLKPKSVAK